MKAEGFVKYAYSSYVRVTPAYSPAAGFSWHSQAATGGTIDGGIERNVLYRGRRTSRDDAGVPAGTGGSRGPGSGEAHGFSARLPWRHGSSLDPGSDARARPV